MDLSHASDLLHPALLKLKQKFIENLTLTTDFEGKCPHCFTGIDSRIEKLTSFWRELHLAMATSFSLLAISAFLLAMAASFFQASQAVLAWPMLSSQDCSLLRAAPSSSLSLAISASFTLLELLGPKSNSPELKPRLVLPRPLM